MVKRYSYGERHAIYCDMEPTMDYLTIILQEMILVYNVHWWDGQNDGGKRDRQGPRRERELVIGVCVYK